MPAFTFAEKYKKKLIPHMFELAPVSTKIYAL